MGSYSQETRRRLVIGFVFLLFIVGLGLIWLIYGQNAALLGFLCLIGFSIPVGLIILFLFGLGKIADKNK